MPTYPTFSNGRTFMSPLIEEVYFKVRVMEFIDGKQQRFSCAPRVARFTLTHEGLSKTDALDLIALFEARKAGYGEWDITIDGVLYEHMVFEPQRISVIETSPMQYSATLAVRQLRS